MTKERIEIIRQALIPFVKKELLEINNEGLGKSDAEEFEKDLNEVLDLSVKALDCVSLGVYKQVAWERDIAIEQLKELGYSFGEKIRTCENCVSREAVLKQMKEWRDCEFVKMTNPYHYLEKRIQSMPPVTPTFQKGTTNYDVLKAVFGNTSAFRIKDTMEFEKGFELWFSKPYQRGGEEW